MSSEQHDTAANVHRFVSVVGPTCEPLSPTTLMRAEELIAKGRAREFQDRAGRPGIQILSIAEAPPSRPTLPGTKSSKVRRRRVASLRRRDGDQCFFCLEIMKREEMTFEHLLAEHKGGGEALENMVLAHGPCNEMAGHLSIMEKVKIREAALRASLSL